MNTETNCRYYKIITSKSIKEFEDKINNNLQLNYRLVGDLKLDKCPQTNKTIYIQAIIKKNEKDTYHWNQWE